jgi:hypothetical protein
MVKFLRYTGIILFGFLWFLGCNKNVSKYLFDKDILKDDYRYGDLYRLSNLPQFKEAIEICEVDSNLQKGDVALYLAGDSFTEPGRISEKEIGSLVFFRGKVAESNAPMPKTTKRKVLIIETVERHFRERFASPWSNWDFSDEILTENSFLDEMLAAKVPYNAQLHESELFGYDFTLKVKELKALFNLKILNKVDDKVKLSKNKKHLLYYLDVNPGISSSFDIVSDNEIENLIKNVNITYDNYKRMGFDEVYLSIIPNKTSILGKDLGEYNQLVNRVEGNEKLRMPIISIINDFEKGHEAMYAKGDTHWSCEGKKIWTDKVNAILLNPRTNSNIQ